MMAGWTKLLPFFVVEWFAKRNCERFSIDIDGPWEVASPYKGTMFFLKSRK